ncbi:MAG: PRC-barrel domain protein [Rariglobus sp.]|jgi:hypothetical protein|nr:PRC-barrel domain protein [Rariglobus sp.]
MKTSPLKTITVGTLVLGLGPMLIAATTTGPAPQTTNPSQTRQSGSPDSQGEPAPDRIVPNTIPATSANYEDSRGRPASALIGRDVVGANDARLGQLGDFLVDSYSGKIIYGVVSTGGTKVPGVVLRAVPFNAFIPELATDGLRLRLNIEEATWAKVPSFEIRQLDRLSKEGVLREDIYRYFGQQPPLVTRMDEQQLVSARETTGKPVLRGDQTIGNIEDVIVHLEAQVAAVLFDPRDDFVGTDQKFILPFGSLARIENNVFVTALNLQDFTTARVSTDATWAMSTGAFRTPYLWPAYGTSATPLTNTPPLQNVGLSATRPPVEEIRQALASDAHTRWTQVNVVAAHDRVILQGVVQDEDDKRRVESRVSQSAGGWKIDNQIRIAGAVGD